jgi:hypothetical protein
MPVGLKAFLDALPSAGSSPYAYAAYVVVAGVWALYVWRAGQPQREARRILAMYKDGDDARTDALRELTGNAPPIGLPAADILAWVRIQATNRGRGLLLAAYLTTLGTIIIVGVVALVRGKTDASSPLSARITLKEIADDRCASLPQGAKLVATFAGKARTIDVVNGCEAAMSWTDTGTPVQARFGLREAGTYALTDPTRTFWIKGGEDVSLGVTPTGEVQPRLKVLLLPYTNENAPTRTSAFLRTILQSKIQALADSLVLRDPGTPASKLKIVEAQDSSMSLDELRQRWLGDHLLEISSGILHANGADTIARSRVYLGDLTTPSSLVLEMGVNEKDFSQSNDSHALALLVALAADAEKTHAPRRAILAYVGEAAKICQDLPVTNEGIRQLKRSIADIASRWNPRAGSLCQ